MKSDLFDSLPNTTERIYLSAKMNANALATQRMNHNVGRCSFLARCFLAFDGNSITTCQSVPKTTKARISMRSRSFVSAKAAPSLRRTRKPFERYIPEGNVPGLHSRKEQKPVTFGGEAIGEYNPKATLSPWVPVPDIVARRMFDLSKASSNDIHVDLGSGDGRVNFHAIDSYNVKHTTGIDIDEKIIDFANQRLNKRHPKPTNVEFIVADLLLDTTTKSSTPAKDGVDIWKKIQQASIITMYFATDGLKLIRPILEQKLAGLSCTMITVGYPMPGWNSYETEVVLGTQIHMYRWGNSSSTDDSSEINDEEFWITGEDDVILQNATEFKPQNSGPDRFNGANLVDHTGKFPIRGINIDIIRGTYKFDDDEENDDESDVFAALAKNKDAIEK